MLAPKTLWRARPALIPLAIALSAIVAMACATDVEVEPDALECYSGGMPPSAEARGSIELGWGTDDFRPIEPDQTLTLQPGLASPHYFEIHTRITDLEPGNPDAHDDPSNPHTLVSVFDEDGQRVDVHACGSRRAYQPDGESSDALVSWRNVTVATDFIDQADGARARIVAEILDANGGYAENEVWVTVEVEDR